MRRQTATGLLCAGVSMLVCSILLCVFSIHHAMQETAIIGGADMPTVWYLLQSGAFTPFIIPGAAGIVLIVIGTIVRLRKKP